MALQDSIDQLKDFDLSDLDVNNIGNWPGIVKGILLAIVFIAFLIGGYYFVLTEKQQALEKAQKQEASLRTEYESKAEQAANLEEYREQKAEMERMFDSLLSQLPKDTEVPGLLEDITRTALDNELTIESIELKPENRTEFYIELPIQIVVEGDYHKIGTFVSGVANLSRIVTLHDFTIQPESSPNALKMDILAKTYRYLDEEA